VPFDFFGQYWKDDKTITDLYIAICDCIVISSRHQKSPQQTRNHAISCPQLEIRDLASKKGIRCMGYLCCLYLLDLHRVKIGRSLQLGSSSQLQLDVNLSNPQRTYQLGII
jgi:hypothetical protein